MNFLIEGKFDKSTVKEVVYTYFIEINETKSHNLIENMTFEEFTGDARLYISIYADIENEIELLKYVSRCLNTNIFFDADGLSEFECILIKPNGEMYLIHEKPIDIEGHFKIADRDEKYLH